jgi:hypothetical protein
VTIEFVIPGLRLKGGLNAREHWRARASRAAKEKSAATLFMREVWPKPNGFDLEILLPLAITITRVGPRKLDDDNLAGSAKHVRDAIARVIGLDDGSDQLHWTYEQARGRYGVKVSIAVRTLVWKELRPA